MKKNYILFFLFFLNFFFSQTLNVRLNEINFYGDSSPNNLIKITDKIFFKATDYKNSSNLYSYDLQTKTNTLLLSSFITNNTYQVSVNGQLYFLFYNGSNWEFWKSNGTKNGTLKLVDLNASINQISEFLEYQGKFYLISGNDLWVTDGTQSGTIMLKKFNNVLSGGIGLNGLTAFNGKIYFGASDEPVNKEVWSTDGTVAGTQKLKEIHPTYSSIDSKFLGVVSGNYLYFGAMYGQDLYGLFKTDGTSEGTTMVKKMNIYALRGIAFQDKIYFSASEGNTGSEMWVSDGTEAGTHIVKDIAPGNASGFSYDDFIGNFNGQIYFTSKSITSGLWKMEIWKTDGTEDGTSLVNSIDQYIEKAFVSSDKNNIIFNTSSASSTYKYFVFNINGTVTPLPVSVFPGNNSFVDLNQDEIIFPIYDNDNYGTELFTYNLKDNTYKNLTDVNSVGSADPTTFYVTEQKDLIFQAESKQYGNEFFRINKNSNKPELIKDLFPKYGQTLPKGQLMKIGNYLYLKNSYYSTTLNSVIRTDGTAEKTESLGDSYGLNIISDDLFENLNDEALIFTSNSYLPTSKLYKLDNNKQSPELIKELTLAKPDGIYSHAEKNYLYNKNLYFLVKENNKNVIYRTDGTAANTIKVISFDNSDGSDGNPRLLGVFNNKLLLSRNKLKYGANSEMWSYDSETGSLSKVKTYYHKDNVDGQNLEESITDINISNNLMYVMAKVGNDTDFYVTENGVEKHFYTSNASFLKLDVINCGENTFLLTGSDRYTTYQIFKTDRTPEGTYSIQENYGGIVTASCVKGYLYYLSGNSNKISRTNGSRQPNEVLNTVVTNSDNQDDLIIYRLIPDGDTLHFVGKTESSGVELYSVTTELPIYLNIGEAENASSQKIKLLLYPNPASEFIKVKYDKDYNPESYKIYNMAGNIVSSGKYTQENQTIDVSKINKGLYVIEIKSKDGILYSQKFIKN